MKRAAFVLAASLVSLPAQAQPQASASAPTPAAQPPGVTGGASAGPGAPGEPIFAGALRAYHAALVARRLATSELQREDIAERVAEAEGLLGDGRVDEAVARLAEVVEHPGFALYAGTEEGRAAVYRLGDALASAGIVEAARGYLVRSITAPGAWDGRATWARRAVAKLVDVALTSGGLAAGETDLASVPADAPAEVRGEVAYLKGRAAEAAGAADRALAAYGAVPARCRFWAEATYLSALIDVERGDWRAAEALLCKVADPRRGPASAPVFADEKFFAVRDLARLGLGRLAHEQGRNDDARYYYYLVPRDSDRLAEALYEAATTRYEKKDYDGAAELLRELSGLGVHHRYEDEAWVLGAWIDLARCRFEDADRKLRAFAARYEPVRDLARRLAASDAATAGFMSAMHAGPGAFGNPAGADADARRAAAALVRIDPAYDRVVELRAVLERQASGLVNALAVVGDMQRALAQTGALRPALDPRAGAAGDDADVRDALQAADRQLAELASAGAPADARARLAQELAALRSRARAAVDGERAPADDLQTTGDSAGRDARTGDPPRADLGALLASDAAEGPALWTRIDAERRQLAGEEAALARDALHRLDLRLTRLLQRVRLGRIEGVLGRKRALEVEVEAIRMGYLPREAVDSLDAARYLRDDEEYWPFEGDDWPDEYVGSEGR